MVKGIGFADRQGINISAQANGASAGAAPEHADDAGPADACVGLDAHPLQQIGNQCCRPLLFEAELGVLVDIASPGDPSGF